MAITSKRRETAHTGSRPHIFKEGVHWKCRNFSCTGFGYTWQGAWDDWNGLLTNIRTDMRITNTGGDHVPTSH